jgi:hypothetical protein
MRGVPTSNGNINNLNVLKSESKLSNVETEENLKANSKSNHSKQKKSKKSLKNEQTPADQTLSVDELKLNDTSSESSHQEIQNPENILNEN